MYERYISLLAHLRIASPNIDRTVDFLKNVWGLEESGRDKGVVYLRGCSVSVGGSKFYCSVDGEIYGPERHRTWRVEPAAYSMVLPR